MRGRAAASRFGREAGVVCLLLVFLFSAWGSVAPAGEPEPARAEEPAAEGPRRLPSWLEAGVELRWRGEFRDNTDLRLAEDFDFFTGQRIRVRLGLRVHRDLKFVVEGQDVWLYGAERDKVIHNFATNLRQAYLAWTPAGDERWQLLAGRQEFIYGRERLVGAFGWDNVGRTFDAVRLRYMPGGWGGDFFWGRHVEVRRGGAGHRVGHRDLYGAYWARSGGGNQTELYGLFFHDGQRRAGEVSPVPEATGIFTVGFRRERAPATGFRYEVENAWQLGERGPDSHRAVAVVAKGGYGWGGRWRPAVGLEYDFASGDDDPSDGNSNEFENLFPTNHSHYGYADLVGLRNLHNFGVTTSARLHAKLLVQGDYHRFLLAEKRGPWKSAGGVVLGFDPTGESGRDLGQEFDLTVTVPLERRVTLQGGYSVFLPGRFAIRTRGPETHHFGYLQTTLRF